MCKKEVERVRAKLKDAEGVVDKLNERSFGVSPAKQALETFFVEAKAVVETAAETCFSEYSTSVGKREDTMDTDELTKEGQALKLACETLQATYKKFATTVLKDYMSMTPKAKTTTSTSSAEEQARQPSHA